MTSPTIARVMIVSGARKGIGRHLVEHYLEADWTVVGCSRGPSDLAHPRYEHVCLDVGDEAGVRALFAGVKRSHGYVDAVINNAGIATMNHILLTPGASVQAVLSTNVLGTFLFCREGARLMRHRPAARIVNFATVATPLRLEGEAIYAASKAAVVSLTQILARELAPLRITVNAVGPTPVLTDLTRGVPAAAMDALIARQAIPRWGEFVDVANVVDFFLQPGSDFVTGQVVYLGGVS